MKATGIVRRIDDLGRVVIPKEIRRTLRIRDGDPLEIFTEGNGEIVFRKYSPMGEALSVSEQYAEAMAKHTEYPVVICDCDRSIAAAGISKKEALDKAVSHELDMLLESRKPYILTAASKPFFPFENGNSTAAVIYPILSSGDIYGAVIMLKTENASYPTETDVSLASVAAAFLGKQSE